MNSGESESSDGVMRLRIKSDVNSDGGVRLHM